MNHGISSLLQHTYSLNHIALEIFFSCPLLPNVILCAAKIIVCVHAVQYISSAASLYFPYDFCLYSGMTAVVSYSLRYIPFILSLIISTVLYTVNKCVYRKQQKLSGRKVSRFDRICENVEKTFVILLP